MELSPIYQELANGLLVIPALLSGISQTEAAEKPDVDTWSILEVMCHLYDEECEDFRVRLDLILHNPASDWPPIDPQGWVNARQYSQQNFAEIQQRWLAERQRSLAWLGGLADANWDAFVEAPFGAVRAGDMLAAWAAHDNLHIRQLVELRRFHLTRTASPYDLRYAGDW